MNPNPYFDPNPRWMFVTLQVSEYNNHSAQQNFVTVVPWGPNELGKARNILLRHWKNH